MITYQDYINSENKEKFIIKAIEDFKASDFYNNSLISRRYYEGKNDILERLQWFWNAVDEGDRDRAVREKDNFKANNRISNNFFKKIVMQEKSYLLSNGTQIDEKYKKDIKKLDETLDDATFSALLDGKSFIYSNINKGKFSLSYFKGNEFVPLYDERYGVLSAGIRFYQLSSNRPMYIELYELDGITEFTLKDSKLTQLSEKSPYEKQTVTNALGVVVKGKSWSSLPIIELKSDDFALGRFPLSLKSKIDLYDRILSDFGNNLEDCQDIYWVLKNYGGTSMADFLEEFKHYKTVKTEHDADATPHTIEVPYEARKTALEILRAKIYEESMAVDTSILSGGSLTNVAIEAAYTDLDLKVDSLEVQVKKAVSKIINLFEEYQSGIGNEVEVETDISFVRNVLMNKNETVEDIINLRAAGELSRETAVRRNPYVDNEEKELKLLEEENMSIFREVDNKSENVIIE